MSVSMTFDSTKNSLLDLLRDIERGKTQLPDFQRGWIWDDEHVRSLLASISLSYPIGAVMLLNNGNADIRFKPLLVEGVELDGSPAPDRLILDGQQRLTSLFQALLLDRPVATRDSRSKQIKRWYYLNVPETLNPFTDREEAIISVPEDRKVKNFRGEVIEDYSTPEKEYERGMFPFSRMFESADWGMEYQEYWDYDKEKIKQFNGFVQNVVKRFEQYQVPVIALGEETPKEAVCQVFEKVNTGGVPLTVFELLTATYAAEDFNLKEDWLAHSRRLKSYDVLTAVRSTEFLQAVALLATRDRKGRDPERAVSCKRKEILRLPLEDYIKWSEPLVEGFERAAKLLHSQKIFTARDLPYPTQLVPLAAVMTALGERAESDNVRSRLARWFWCGVLGELYGSAVETRFARDLPEILAWLENGGEPTTITEANFAPARLLTLRNRNSAAYKGIHALLLRDGGQDFRSGESVELQTYFDNGIDIHHIFPQKWCQDHGIEAGLCNSIVNKTPIAARTNRLIGRKAPSEYLNGIQKDAGIPGQRMDEILCSHVVEADRLRADDFEAFFDSRRKALLKRVERAMDKSLTPEPGEDEILETEEQVRA